MFEEVLSPICILDTFFWEYSPCQPPCLSEWWSQPGLSHDSSSRGPRWCVRSKRRKSRSCRQSDLLTRVSSEIFWSVSLTVYTTDSLGTNGTHSQITTTLKDEYSFYSYPPFTLLSHLEEPGFDLRDLVIRCHFKWRRTTSPS